MFKTHILHDRIYNHFMYIYTHINLPIVQNVTATMSPVM